MRVVMLAARKRNESGDQVLIKKLIDTLIEKYPQLKVVTGSCDRGVGKIIKTLCLPEELGPKSPAQFRLMEIHVRPYLPKPEPELTSTEFAELFTARNAFFNEYGEEFHLFIDGPTPRGMIQDLYNRVRARNAPVAIYKPGDQEVKDAAVWRA